MTKKEAKQHGRICRANAQKQHLLDFIRYKLNEIGGCKISLNVEETRTFLKQSISQIQIAFKSLNDDKQISVISRQKIGKELFYTIQLNNL